MTTISIKRGDTLLLKVTVNDLDGNPLEGEAENIKSEIRDRFKKLITTFLVSEDGNGVYSLSLPDGVLLPVGVLYFDIQQTIAGVVSSSNTVTVNVLQDITQ